jgi:transposase
VAHVIHASSVAVSREHRRAKTDRLDVNLLQRAFLGWLRGERGHCSMAAIPTLAAEDARRPSREHQALVGERTRIVNRMKSAHCARLGIRDFKPHLRKATERLAGLRTPEEMALPPNTMAELRRDMSRLQLVKEQIAEIERTRLERLRQPPADPAQAMLGVLTRVVGIGIETADLLVNELLTRNLRDRRAVARYGGITGAPDESGARRREKGLARAGNARVRRAMLQLAWRFLLFQKESALVKWFQLRTADGRMATRKTMILALARKLLIALWRLAPARCRRASPCVRPHEGFCGADDNQPQMTNRGSGAPMSDMALAPRSRMDPPPRSSPADAHDCIMVPIRPDRPNTSLWRGRPRQWQAPLGPSHCVPS